MKLQLVICVRDGFDTFIRCMQSVVGQTLVEHIDVCVVDDASSDPMQRKYAASLCRVYGWILVQNEERQGAMANQFTAITRLSFIGEPDDVLVFLDGDDRLAHPFVLANLWHQYRQEPSLLVTYGSYEPDPETSPSTPARPYPREAWAHPKSVRGWSWAMEDLRFNHLRTFRRCLFDEMHVHDFTHPDGSWFMTCADTALMIPALELAGPDRYRFIEEVLLIYTADHEQADWRMHADDVRRTNPYILTKVPHYNVLERKQVTG